MLGDFLRQHRSELIERCRAKVQARRAPRPSDVELEHGVPLFLDQLIETLRMHEQRTPRPMVSTAISHGDEMLRMGFTVEQVVHDYGDLCQAVTELAGERGTKISSDDFQTLNRCLDDAIAGAVAEFARVRSKPIPDENQVETDLLIGATANELQTLLRTATLAFDAIKSGRVATNGSTASELDRSLRAVRRVVDRSLLQVRLTAGMRKEDVGVADLVSEVDAAATLDALAYGVRLTVVPVDAALAVHADRAVLVTVLAHLLENAFRFTHKNGHDDVSLRVRRAGDRLHIDVEDECGGLPTGTSEDLFWPFAQSNRSRFHAGDLGLAICRRAVEANGGTLSAKDRPDRGCVFTVNLAAHATPMRDLSQPRQRRAESRPRRAR
jgi:signal transduction histidine kinase